jgi:CHAT domain-containing protein/tetratricopeptide (TPR) repeat protein
MMQNSKWLDMIAKKVPFAMKNNMSTCAMQQNLIAIIISILICQNGVYLAVAYATTNTREKVIGLLEQQRAAEPTIDSLLEDELKTHQEAYKVAKGSNDVLAAAAIANLIGRNLERSRQFQKALVYFTEGLQILLHRQVADLPALEVEMNLKEYVGDAEGRYSRDLCHAEMPPLAELFALPDEKVERILFVSLRVNAGNMYLKQNQVTLGVALYREALTSAKQLPSSLAIQQIYTNLAWAALAGNHLSEAAKLLGSALVEQSPVSVFELRKAFFVAGVVSKEQGHIQQAIQGLEQARILYEQAKDDEGTAKVLAHLATAYAEARNVSKAVETYQAAIDLNESIKDDELASHAYAGIAKAYTDLKNYHEALHYYELYWQAVQRVGEEFTTDQGSVSYLEGQRRALEDYVSLAMKVADETGNYVYARRLVEDVRGWSLKKLGQPKSTPQKSGSLSISFLTQQAFGWDLQECGRFLINARVDPDRKDCHIERDSSEVPAPEVAPPPAIFIDYFLLEQELMIFVKSASGEIIGKVVTIKSEQLGRLIDEYFHTLRVRNVATNNTFPERGHASPNQNETNFHPEVKVSRELYDLLIGPVREWLPKNPQEPIVIVPHRSIWRIPFVTLLDEDNQYFGDQHVLTYAPSESMWMKSASLKRRADHRSVRAWVVGDPKMPAQVEACGSEFSVSSLPGARAEAKEIARLMNKVGKAELFVGSQADRLRFEAWYPDFSVLHLATHAGACANDALNSFIIMTGLMRSDVTLQGSNLSVNDDPRFPIYVESLESSPRRDFSIPGLLKMWEVLARFHTNADLVTLSACQTAKGTETGQGVIGFSRAFLAAGARSLLVSLWSVADKPTQELIVVFYEEYLLHGNKGLALQRAMQHTRENYPSPRYWAAFSLHGVAE